MQKKRFSWRISKNSLHKGLHKSASFADSLKLSSENMVKSNDPIESKSRILGDFSLLVPPQMDEVDDKIEFDASLYFLDEKKIPSHLSNQEAIQQITENMKKDNDNFLMNNEYCKITKTKLEQLKQQIREAKVKGEIDPIRHPVRYEIAANNYAFDFAEEEIARAKKNIFIYGQMITAITKRFQTTNTEFYVDLKKFIREILPENSLAGQNNKTFVKNKLIISRFFQPIQPLPVDPNDKVAVLLSQTNKSGRIIQKFKFQAANFSYDDLDVIADALLEQNHNFTKDEIIQILFDVAWSVKKYPIATREVVSFMIPTISDLVPAIFNPPYLTDKWKLMTFQELSQTPDWPLKKAVDSLFDIMLDVNPFDIAKHFSNTINLVADGIQEMVNKDASEIEVDFDQLFNLLIVCIFTSGLSDITKPMSYAHQFSEYVSDPDLQFAMSHMEGLCSYFPTINFRKIRNDSMEIVKKHQQNL